MNSQVQSYYDRYWKDIRTAAPERDPMSSVRSELIMRALEGETGLKILDAGCGTGAVVGQLDQAGHHVIGLDVSTRAIEVARERYPGLDFWALPIESRYPVADDFFDVIVSLEVIEH